MSREVSYNDERDTGPSFADALLPPGKRLELAREWAKAEPEKAGYYFPMLPRVDGEICRFYFVQDMPQDRIGGLLGIDQSVVSDRLQSGILLLGVLLKRPTHNPIELASDLEALLPPELVEAALYLCIELSPSRVMYMLKESESGAANKLTAILKRLERLVAIPSRGPYDADTLKALGLVGDDGAVLNDGVVTDRRKQASRYLEFFRRLRTISHRKSRVLKETDAVRTPALFDGESII